MRHFLCDITGDMPYPVLKTYQIDATTWHTALARAVKQYMTDSNGKSRRLTELNIKIRPLQGITKPQDEPQED